ncbi:FG-GAP-like repeat-containing protein [Aquisphaera insulae]|uniref:FG-GAP-like repeat-containing protein n=1 Tax=Aquisphaera insulae TaxID=2712864 RepID=UPI0013EC4650|nr:FG-GAP-like repeat-containing protein [Aquisphaera insulae]
MRRRWRRLAIGAGLLALAWGAFMRLDAWRSRGQLGLAQREIGRGQFEIARQRLTALAARDGALDGMANYWLGICESLDGHSDAAARAFDRVPPGFAFDPIGAYHEAKANLSRGRLLPAERRLEAALGQDGPVREKIRELLRRVYELEVRFDDVRGLVRDRLAAAEDPLNDLRDLSNLDLNRLPYEGLRGAIEKAGTAAPEDARVWLGKSRLAIEAGHWDEADDWLRKCRQAGADAPVWRAQLEWARGTSRTAEAIEAARRLGRDGLDPAARLDLRAWLAGQDGDREAEASALDALLVLEPGAIRAMERLVDLAHQAGRAERVAELRRRQGDVEGAMAAYRVLLWRKAPPHTPSERIELARLAEAAGLRHEARALFAWGLRATPDDPAAREGLARLDRDDPERRQALAESARDLPQEGDHGAGRPAMPSRPADSRLAFTDDAESAGLRFVFDNAETILHQLPEPFSGGLAVLDVDNDGWLDVFCVQGGPYTPDPSAARPAADAGDRLFRNRGDGTFEDITARSGIDCFPRGHGHGVAVGDVDNDGLPDLFVTRWRSYALYRNLGGGRFEDATDHWGLGGSRDWPTSAAFADLDGDGDLDLYVCHYAAWDLDHPQICRDAKTQAYLNCNPLDSEALPDHLFRNDGGRFVDVTAEAGIVDGNGRGLGVVAADLDADGRVDLFVANDSSADYLFHNRGGMRFEEIGHLAGVASNSSGIYQAGMGTAAGDLDGDGLIDLIVTNFYGESTTFFRGLGGGTFTDTTEAIGLTIASRHLLGFGVGLVDVNDDGRLDMVTANGHVNDLRPNYPYQMPARVLLAGADGRLKDVSDLSGDAWKVPRMGRGLAVVDLDNDGRQDVLILSHNQPMAYFHNRTEGGRFLTLRLEGTRSNRDAVGAKVTLIRPGGNRVAWRTGGGSFQSASDPRIHFGLGADGRIEAVEVAWPSGRVNQFRGFQPDSGYLLREGHDRPEQLDGFRGRSPRP